MHVFWYTRNGNIGSLKPCWPTANWGIGSQVWISLCLPLRLFIKYFNKGKHNNKEDQTTYLDKRLPPLYRRQFMCIKTLIDIIVKIFRYAYSVSRFFFASCKLFHESLWYTGYFHIDLIFLNGWWNIALEFWSFCNNISFYILKSN